MVIKDWHPGEFRSLWIACSYACSSISALKMGNFKTKLGGEQADTLRQTLKQCATELMGKQALFYFKKIYFKLRYIDRLDIWQHNGQRLQCFLVVTWQTVMYYIIELVPYY